MSGGNKAGGSTTRTGQGPKAGGKPKSKGAGGGGGGGPPGNDPCDRQYDLNLTSVDVAAARLIKTGERLSVQLNEDAGFESVVCNRRGGGYVGGISGIQGLSQLINCLREGRTYAAEVTAVVGTASVSVHVALDE